MTWKGERAGLLARLDDAERRLDALEGVVEPPPPRLPWFGHIDGERGHDGLDTLLAEAIGVTRPVGTFVRGYSGSSHPATFAASSVRSAETLGIGAMLNVKRDWGGLIGGPGARTWELTPEQREFRSKKVIDDWTRMADGQYDDLIRGFFESWPVGVFGDVYPNHEPENDGPLPASLTNPAYVTWAQQNAPIWCAGIRHYIDLAAPIIRARGLDVKVGGCLMGFSWDSDRWQLWNWWDGITPANLDQVVFSIDHYGKHRDTDPNPHAADIMPQVRDEFLPVLRAAGIGALSFGEFNLDRRKYGTETVIGTPESQAAGLLAHAAEMTAIPETRTVCAFYTPGGPASGQAQLNGVALDAWATVCMSGRRP